MYYVGTPKWPTADSPRHMHTPYWRCRSSSKPFAGAESGSPGRALEAGKRGSPGRPVQAGIRGKRLRYIFPKK